MTPLNNEASPALMGTAPTGTATSALGSGAVHPRRAELETFIASTRRELQALSQTLNENATPARQPATDAPLTVLADSPHQGAVNTVSEHDAVGPLSVETVASELHTLPSTDSPLAPNTDPTSNADTITSGGSDSNADPMVRLNAVKLRLAQQIQNAS